MNFFENYTSSNRASIYEITTQRAIAKLRSKTMAYRLEHADVRLWTAERGPSHH